MLPWFWDDVAWNRWRIRLAALSNRQRAPQCWEDRTRKNLALRFSAAAQFYAMRETSGSICPLSRYIFRCDGCRCARRFWPTFCLCNISCRATRVRSMTRPDILGTCRASRARQTENCKSFPMSKFPNMYWFGIQTTGLRSVFCTVLDPTVLKPKALA